MKEWLNSAGSERSVGDLIVDSADLTKDALRLIAEAAPKPVAENDLVRRLTALGYRATDTTRDALVTGLDAVGLVQTTGLASAAKRAYSINAKTARQVLKLLR